MNTGKNNFRGTTFLILRSGNCPKSPEKVTILVTPLPRLYRDRHHKAAIGKALQARKIVKKVTINVTFSYISNGTMSHDTNVFQDTI